MCQIYIVFDSPYSPCITAIALSQRIGYGETGQVFVSSAGCTYVGRPVILQEQGFAKCYTSVKFAALPTEYS